MLDEQTKQKIVEKINKMKEELNNLKRQLIQLDQQRSSLVERAIGYEASIREFVLLLQEDEKERKEEGVVSDENPESQ
jgi:hypothetical protein